MWWALFPAAPGTVGTQAECLARAFGFTSTPPPAPMDILIVEPAR